MKGLADVKFAASMSLHADELAALDEVLTKLLRNADVRALAKRPAIAGIARKVTVAKATLERQRARRAVLGAKDVRRG